MVSTSGMDSKMSVGVCANLQGCIRCIDFGLLLFVCLNSQARSSKSFLSRYLLCIVLIVFVSFGGTDWPLSDEAKNILAKRR